MAILHLKVIDSHTGGEPTRVVIEGFPGLGQGTVKERYQRFEREFDHFRSALVTEPRTSDVWVGAILMEPHDPTCTLGVAFFNNVAYLGMCGHGTIGLITTLDHMGRIDGGTHRIETPVGVIEATLHEDGQVSFQNVASYRTQKDVNVTLADGKVVAGDVAFGGNWFFLISDHGQDLSLANVDQLTHFTWQVREALYKQGITGDEGAEIDHIELFGPSDHADSKSFVLCPGKAYDRSPCGTGTSAKLACLFSDGKLPEGQVWRQESITGSIFEGFVTVRDDQIYPTIKGRAYVNAEATVILNEEDPCCWGIRG